MGPAGGESQLVTESKQVKKKFQPLASLFPPAASPPPPLQPHTKHTTAPLQYDSLAYLHRRVYLYCTLSVAQLFGTMTGRGNPGGRKTLLAPIHFIFKLLQQRSTVSIWLYEQLSFRIEGKIRVRQAWFPKFIGLQSSL
jgi:hypothetical protein